jgi:4-amino-4-deoxy-L-arabinose transferase-like glycosyltransferase
MKNLTFIILGLIILLAAIIRLYRLGSDGHPLLWDEASLGYNAYSILKTGRDEYGAFLPLVLKSFGDYKPALYTYLAMPMVAVMGLTETAVRLPSALAGIAIVAFLYLITNELYPDKNINLGKWKLSAGTLTASLAALNPWLIHFSRGAWEANVNLLLTLGGTWAFLRARRRPGWLVIAGLFFGLTFLAYQSAKLFTPLLVLGLLCQWGKPLFRFRRESLIGLGLTVLLGMAVIAVTIGSGTGRLSVMSVFAYPRPAADVLEIARQDGISPGSWQFTLLHGEWLAQIRRFFEGYFNHFSGRFLFYEGDWNDGRLGSPYVGQFYWPDLLFLIIGLAAVIKIGGKSAAFLLFWLAISPLPAALSRDIIQAVRALNLAIPLLIFCGLGLFGLIEFTVRKEAVVGVFLLLLVAVYGWNVWYYLDSYFVHAPIISSADWLYGYKQAVTAVDAADRQNFPVVVTQKLGQPYIYFLFYNRVNPSAYQQEAKLQENLSGDVGEVGGYGNLTFRNIYWPADRGLTKTFFVGTEDELPLKDIDPQQASVLEDIKRSDGTVALRIVETKF